MRSPLSYNTPYTFCSSDDFVSLSMHLQVKWKKRGENSNISSCKRFFDGRMCLQKEKKKKRVDWFHVCTDAGPSWYGMVSTYRTSWVDEPAINDEEDEGDQIDTETEKPYLPEVKRKQGVGLYCTDSQWNSGRRLNCGDPRETCDREGFGYYSLQ